VSPKPLSTHFVIVCQRMKVVTQPTRSIRSLCSHFSNCITFPTFCVFQDPSQYTELAGAVFYKQHTATTPVLQHNIQYTNNTIMTWWAYPLMKSTVKGATITFGSTMVSCALALQVEKSTNRLFFWFAPHWYAGVDHASGITQAQLESVRHLRNDKQSLSTLAATASSSSLPSASITTTEEEREPAVEDRFASFPAFSEKTLFSLSSPSPSSPNNNNNAMRPARTSPPKVVVTLNTESMMSCAMTG